MEEFLFICKEESCYNYILRQASNLKCCDRSMEKFNLPTKICSSDILSDELTQQLEYSKPIKYEETKKWPGPIAFEYRRLVDMMIRGNIEGSCWKLVNLFEVLYCYFHITGLLSGKSYLEEKFTVIKLHYLINPKKKNKHLFDVLDEIRCWRNNYGTGHGSLLMSKSSYLNELKYFWKEINEALYKFNEIIDLETMSPLIKEKITGEYYYLKKNKITISKSEDNKQISLIRTFEYQFDANDIYFFDFYDNGIIKYRNFMNNRVKFINKKDNSICWYKDLKQVSWLDEDETQSWIDYIKKNRPGDALPILLEAVEECQNRGLYERVDTLLETYNVLYKNQKAEIDIRLAIVKYDKNLSVSRIDNEKEINNLIGAYKGLNKEDIVFFKNQFILKKSWHLYVKDGNKEAIKLCEEALENLKFVNSTIKNELLKLRLKRNILFFKRDEDEYIEKNMEECLDAITLATLLFNSDPGNHKIADLIGFFCNLYGSFYFNGLKGQKKIIGKGLVKKVKLLHKYGEAIRKSVYDLNPNDVWAIRGYTWSLHHGARIKRLIDDKYPEALDILNTAKDIREDALSKNKYPNDLGLIECTVKNFIEIAEVLKELNEPIKDIKSKAANYLQSIKLKEGESKRYIALCSKLKSI